MLSPLEGQPTLERCYCHGQPEYRHPIPLRKLALLRWDYFGEIALMPYEILIKYRR
ncbi:MAG: hypothetical protein AB2992_06670 [Candidatus Symbiodolus clandestinus]